MATENGTRITGAEKNTMPLLLVNSISGSQKLEHHIITQVCGHCHGWLLG